MQIELTTDGEHRIQQHAHTRLGGDEITNPLSDAREQLDQRLLLRRHAPDSGRWTRIAICASSFVQVGRKSLAPVIRGPPEAGVPAR